ncbi:tetratricopeptide repeat protein [Afifella sp. YEN Y35]|uniref:tetratricopeptide repeat protein n=1 Tax=Afifella sp. YEN Y35 TaxID=3388337 RepID=UPI0039E100D4
MDAPATLPPQIEFVQAAPAAELDEALHRRIVALSRRGDEFAEAGRFASALTAYDEAVALLPEPKSEWSAWTWLQAARGDAFFLEGDWPACRDAFRKAVAGPDGLGNPFIHLRLGECALELGDEDRAKDDLMRAYMGGGSEIFEDDDPKYLAFLRRFADID